MPRASSNIRIDTDTLPGGREFYGVKVFSIGHEGEWFVAFGDVPRLLMIAACNRYARKVEGLENLFDGKSLGVADLMVYTKPASLEYPAPEGSEWQWEIKWGSGTPNANYLITILERW